ncbi:MAG: hypothetical protein V1873_02505 [Verrucomicrobiota bacterium]
MKSTYPLLLALVLAATAARADVPGFERYQVILDRKPFGEPPPQPVVPSTIAPEQSFARNIRMSALLESNDGEIRIGLIDLQSNQNFFLGVGDVENGVELVSADYEKEEAVIKKGDEMALIKLQSGDIQPLTPEQQREQMNQPPPSSSRRPSYAERRLARQQQRQQTPPAPQAPPPQPKYTGEELEKHLRDYQMEVIRQGLPPLPIPLTPEMDQQLVTEGVLPPLQPEQPAP